MELKRKKGLFYTADALLAVSILFIFMLVAVPMIRDNSTGSVIQYDLIQAMSSIKMSEISNSYYNALGVTLTDDDKKRSVLEYIGILYSQDPDDAKTFAQNILNDIDSGRENVGIWIGEGTNQEFIAYKGDFINILVANTSFNDARKVEVAKHFVSGISGSPDGDTGYAARAFLIRSYQTEYYYFGGYVGDGDITINMSYYGDIVSADFEITINDEFDLYVNQQYVDRYQESPSERTPQKYSVNATHLVNFSSGDNIIEFRKVNSSLRISGGYFKIVYDLDPGASFDKKYRFAGVDGIVNLYDGVYVPDINSLNVELHYQSEKDLFFNLGNSSFVFPASATPTRQTFDGSGWDLDKIKEKNVPLRLGVMDFVDGSGGVARVVLVTDYSGSMKKALNDITSTNPNTQGSPEGNCDLINDDNRKTSLAFCLSKDFSSSILTGGTNHMLWPIYFHSDSVSNYLLDPQILSSVQSNLAPPSVQGKDKTCLACAINRGYDLLYANVSGDSNVKNKYIVLMTDGLPTNVPIDWNGITGTSTEYEQPNRCAGFCDFQGACNPSEISECTDSVCIDPIMATRYAAQRAADFNITIFTIGFGSVESCSNASTLMQYVADETGGEYFHSSTTEGLQDIYDEIAEKIKTIVYNEQVASVTQGGTYAFKVFPDSFIEFVYDEPEPEIGFRLSLEKDFTSEFSGSFDLLHGDKVLDARVLSYSGTKWTDTSKISNNTFFNLSNYGKNYVTLGDPFNIYIPLNTLIEGSNQVQLSLNPTDSPIASPTNKIIYTLLRDVSGFSDVVEEAEGCNWTIQTTSGVVNVEVPSGATAECEYKPGVLEENFEDDAYQLAVYNLLSSIDIDGDGVVDIHLNEEFFEIDSSVVKGIPYNVRNLIEVRTWR